MSETKPRRRRSRTGYVPKPRATHITLYSPNGNTVPRVALSEATRAVEAVADQYNLLVSVIEG